MSDRVIICRDCGQEFTFTAGEQSFYQERGFTEPQRCPSCRAARKAQRSGDGFGTGYSDSGRYTSGGYTSGARQMYPAVCSSCGRDTEVPFEPRGDKPVYCRECFQERRMSSSHSGYSRY